MVNLDLMNLFYCITTLFCFFSITQFIVEITIHYKDKSLGNKINSREIILSAWLLLPFIIAYGFSMLLIKSFSELKIPGFIIDNNYLMIFGFLIGLTFMISIFVITVKVKKGKRYGNAILSTEISNNMVSSDVTNIIYNYTVNQLDIDHDDSEISSQDIAVSSNEGDDSSNKDQANINTDNSSKIIVEPRSISEEIIFNSKAVINENDTAEILEDISSGNSEQIDVFDDVKSKELSKKPQSRITKQIYYKGAEVMPIPFSDQIIEQKLESIQKHYLLYCDADDFKELLKKKEIKNKISFKKEDSTTVEFSKVDYLKFMYFIFADNLIEHSSNKKIIEWIDKNFDSKNFEGIKIFPKEISNLRTYVKNQNIEI